MKLHSAAILRRPVQHHVLSVVVLLVERLAAGLQAAGGIVTITGMRPQLPGLHAHGGVLVGCDISGLLLPGAAVDLAAFLRGQVLVLRVADIIPGIESALLARLAL